MDVTCGKLQKEGSFEALDAYFLELQVTEFSNGKVSTPDDTDIKYSKVGTRRFRNYPVFQQYDYYDNYNQRFKRSGFSGRGRSRTRSGRSCSYRSQSEWKDNKCESSWYGSLHYCGFRYNLIYKLL